MYAFIRPLLFNFAPETAHDLALRAIRLGLRGPFKQAMQCKRVEAPCQVMGLKFPNRVGLAAGLDKNGDAINGLAALGFGFLEIGTVTPRPQPGNPQPRLFRVPEKQALINRMGFNNKGVDHLVAQVRRAKFQGILGINIGKNFDTPVEKAVDDYLACFRKVYPYASYVTVNISSPNTKGLRDLQQGAQLTALFSALKNEQAVLQAQSDRFVPLVVKIAPDLTEERVASIAAAVLEYGIDGVIATNTTISREGLEQIPTANEAGGLSGQPLTEKATRVVRQLATQLHGDVPIIASGGVMTPADAQNKLDAGASLVQIYTGLIYQGPSLVHQIARALSNNHKEK